MQSLYSIQTADRIFDTNGCRPILLTCNDMDSYVCKYNTGYSVALRLMCEFIAASFLKIWELNVPDFALITVQREHIPSDYNLNSNYFDFTCFGSKYCRNYAEITNFNANISYQQRRAIPNRRELLCIALFDLWLANEDRNHNNYNLLVDIENQRVFVPIDHEKIFNTRNISIPICELTYQDSIISSPFFLKLFSDKDLDRDSLDDIREYFFSKVQLCGKNAIEIIELLPLDWNIDKKALESKLINEIFVDEWLVSSFNLFLSFLQQNNNIKDNAISL